jgi:hypothetical protein
MFNIERAQYKKRAYNAIEDIRDAKLNERKPKIMSVIIDAMDNNKCKCPYFGPGKPFAKPIPQVIMGVKEHGEVLFNFFLV